MTGWRGRLGVAVPSSNATVEPEFIAGTVEWLDAMSDDDKRLVRNAINEENCSPTFTVSPSTRRFKSCAANSAV